MKFFRPYYSDDCDNVIYLNRPYYIKFEVDYDDYGIPSTARIIEFAPTDKKRNPIGDFVKWGGSPEFRQCEYYPLSDNNAVYDYICTVNNNWGDMGNSNLFILFDKSKDVWEILDVYLESSCS